MQTIFNLIFFNYLPLIFFAFSATLSHLSVECGLFHLALWGAAKPGLEIEHFIRYNRARENSLAKSGHGATGRRKKSAVVKRCVEHPASIY